MSAGADGRILASEDHVAIPDGADYDPSAGEISWDGIREFILQAGGSAWNRHNYSRIWWREEEERRFNFSEYLFGVFK